MKDAEKYLLAGMFEEATNAYQILCEKDKNDAESWNNLGVALYRRERYEQAFQAYKAAFKLKPMDETIVDNIKAVLIELHSQDEAEAMKVFKETLIELLELP